MIPKPTISSVVFENFRALRDATLPLQPLTLIIGPNGSGKSTALTALRHMADGTMQQRPVYGTAGVADSLQSPLPRISVTVNWREPGYNQIATEWMIPEGNPQGYQFQHRNLNAVVVQEVRENALAVLRQFRVYSLTAQELSNPTALRQDLELSETGSGLAGLLDRLRDEAPERFEELNEELPRWITEFDRVLFSTDQNGLRSFLLRTRSGRHPIPAKSLSHGTLFALAILALALAPFTPSVFAIEEPERGIHPRLLHDVYDVLYRVSHPGNVGSSHEPKQVIVTTHSPQLLDLFRETPEAVVVAEKTGADAKFGRLLDRADLARILEDLPLGDAWNLGVLGGVPQNK